MYNEERKLRFISEKKTPSTNKNCISIFNSFEEFEDRNDKDLCEFTLEDINVVLENRFRASALSLRAIFTMLKAYVRWCSEQGYPTAAGVFEFDPLNAAPTEKIKSCLVSSPKHLQELLDKAFDSCEMQTIDVLYRCYAWMAFMGVPKKDALEIKISNINLIKMEINYDEYCYELYREAAEAFNFACTATEFNYINSNYGVQTICRKRKPGKYLLRGIRSEKIAATTIDVAVQKHFKQIGFNYTYERLSQSGLFYRTYEMESQGEGTDLLHGWVYNEIQRREARRPDSDYIKKEKNLLTKSICKAYNDWKAFFRLKK